jgi:hypothetical protein
VVAALDLWLRRPSGGGRALVDEEAAGLARRRHWQPGEQGGSGSGERGGGGPSKEAAG